QEVANGRAYEVTYIVQANVANAVEETQERVKTLIENAGGALDNVRVSEARRLAYPIDKKTDGVYVVINARFAKELTTELDRFFKLEERVLRHVVLREDA
ncbi:30S ribosomal protein S6, partial [bacterium]